MGWSGGSEVMSEIIRGLKKAKVQSDARLVVYAVVVPALENQDADCLYECADDDPIFHAFMVDTKRMGEDQ